MADFNFYSETESSLESEDEVKKLDLKVRYRYTENPDYEIIATMPRIDFDKEKDRDLESGRGFIISSPKATLKKDMKNPEGIFSTRFGQRLGDQNPYMDRYSCECPEGGLKGAINNGLVCPKCGKICKFVDDDFAKFGWIEIDPEYAIIHPDMYKDLDNFFGRSKYIKDKKSKRGSVLLNMIEYDPEMDQNGNIIGHKQKPGEPFYGIGMIEFKERFQEIFDYYYYSKNKNDNKREIYQDIMKDIDKLWIHSIPVYTTLLRPMDVVGETMYFEKTNGFFSMMVKQAQGINKNKRKIDRIPRLKNLQLFKLQKKFIDLYDEIVEILSGKLLTSI